MDIQSRSTEVTGSESTREGIQTPLIFHSRILEGQELKCLPLLSPNFLFLILDRRGELSQTSEFCCHVEERSASR